VLFHSNSDDELFFKKRYIYYINSYFGKGKMYLLFMEFLINMFTFVSKHIDIFRYQIQMQCLANAIMKTLHDELSICYTIFAYVYNKKFA
jgi:hypothetical protein